MVISTSTCKPGLPAMIIILIADKLVIAFMFLDSLSRGYAPSHLLDYWKIFATAAHRVAKMK